MKKITLVLSLIITTTLTAGLYAGGNREGAPEETTQVSMEPKKTAEEQPKREGPLVLDIDTAVDLALANNLTIKSEQLGLRIKNRTRKTVMNNFYPSITAGATLSRMHTENSVSGFEGVNSAEYEGYELGGGSIIDNPFPTGPTDPPGWAVPFPDDLEGIYDFIVPYDIELPRWNISASINMSLTLTAALIYGIKYTVIDYEAGQLSLETAKKSLSRDIKKTFYNLLLLEENIKIMEQKVASMERRFEQAKINYEYGLVDEYTKLSAQVGLENLKPGVDAMKTGYETAKMNFKFLLGLDLEEEIILEGSIEPETIELDAAALIDTYTADRLDIQSLRKQIEILKNAKNATIAGMTPLLTFLLNFDPAFLGDPFEDAWFEKNDDDELNWEQLSGMFAMSLTVPLDSLLPFSSSWVDISNTKDSIRQMYTTLQQAIKGAEMEIWTLVQNLKQTQKTYESLELNVDLAERAYALAEESYNAGGRALIDVEDAEDKLQEARFEVLKEKYNYITNLLDLEYALNTPLEEIRN